jgi:pantothenate kinase
MYAFQIGDLERVMNIPVPYRKWLIERWNKQKENEYKSQNPDKHSDTSKPLSEMERIKFIKKAQESTNRPLPSHLGQMRNAKKP